MSPVIHSPENIKKRMALMAGIARKSGIACRQSSILHDLDVIDLLREGGATVEMDEGVRCGYFIGDSETGILTEELRDTLDNMQMSKDGSLVMDGATLDECERELREGFVENEREYCMIRAVEKGVKP